jgi:hypothetical protein
MAHDVKRVDLCVYLSMFSMTVRERDRVCLCVCVCLHRKLPATRTSYVHMYIYIYIYTCIYTYICIYICIHFHGRILTFTPPPAPPLPQICFILVFVILLLFLVGGLVAGANQENLKKSLNSTLEGETMMGLPVFASGDASHGYFSGDKREREKKKEIQVYTDDVMHT